MLPFRGSYRRVGDDFESDLFDTVPGGADDDLFLDDVWPFVLLAFVFVGVVEFGR